MSAEQRLTELGLELPPAPKPIGSYVTYARSGNLVFTSGHGPTGPDGKLVVGKVGAELSIEQGQLAARYTGLNLLATLRENLGSLDRVVRILKMLGMVNCNGDFGQHPSVINGCSDLFVAVFGDAGRHARSAVGMGSLPLGMAVEIEIVAEVA